MNTYFVPPYFSKPTRTNFVLFSQCVVECDVAFAKHAAISCNPIPFKHMHHCGGTCAHTQDAPNCLIRIKGLGPWRDS
ncbi:hypothetical protein CY34DRAFT_814540 [Suillus luteus UH-Slu-Lm8-n1]|uniref:Unplaced genomic scaffold CY34scaffold_1575, whole genome shotgun sequence n=1 Tax=Suillus luteus UH-Slu-Lm8-n1 TaxID=930992 RepID=A0A0D0ABU2_9AGAM|nr:hypothetical protein CY34DRAFT_814540 [Suillus luteus UH-Slu-Lm8-n1]